MKRLLFFSAASVAGALALTSCNYSSCQPCEEVITETYMHKYGVPVQPQQWTTAGKNGQVIAQLGNGVTVTKSYVNGVLEGETSYTFPHSQLIEKRETYKNDILVKTVIHYLSGVPMQEIVYVSAEENSVTTWSEEGIPQRKELYKNDLLVQGEYYDLENKIESTVVNGDGTRIMRDPYGQLMAKESVQKGRIVSSLLLHAKGTPKEIIPYQEGLVMGEKRTFLPDGEPSTIEEWAAGKQHGITTQFRNGARWAEISYVQGIKEGTETRFADDGETITQEISWKEDMRHGPTRSYIGNKVTTEWFWKDQAVDKASYDEFKQLNG